MKTLEEEKNKNNQSTKKDELLIKIDELEKIKEAKLCIEKLIQGVNPFDDSSLSENDIMNDIRVVRCLHCVPSVLDMVIKKKSRRIIRKEKLPYAITTEQLELFEFSDNAVTLSQIVQKLNSLVNQQIYKKLKYADLFNWLVGLGIVKIEEITNEKTKKVITEKGKKIGLVAEFRQYRFASYTVILYNKNAQKFIVDNIDGLLASINKE